MIKFPLKRTPLLEFISSTQHVTSAFILGCVETADRLVQRVDLCLTHISGCRFPESPFTTKLLEQKKKKKEREKEEAHFSLC